MTAFGHDTEAKEVVSQFHDQIVGKTVVVTGASNQTLGSGTAISFARAKPANLILLARSESKVKPVIDEIKQMDSSINAVFVPVDLTDNDSVRKAAADISGLVDKIHFLINNAGVMAIPFSKNKHGIEMTLAANHVGHFLFTNLLMDKIIAAGAGARIVNLTSLGHFIGPFRFLDYNFADGKNYERWSAYGQSKTANVLFSVSLAQKLAKHGIQSFSVHPGSIYTTQLATHLQMEEFLEIEKVTKMNNGWGFSVSQPKSIEQGVSTTLRAAIDPNIAPQSGAYMSDCNIEPAAQYASIPEYARELWQLSEELVGQKFDI
ncbi:putative short-chain dehydrogenase [Lineolata rhizophorae]|uniref:Putative short-chain dehydrogenase n=1 Tax=Lineolata rhizophorae TaxID=578093 RepID=A0A6A6P168_9PEZI|nr:putative short-chain dehydrogenase [Lineolata rhizophorae]